MLKLQYQRADESDIEKILEQSRVLIERYEDFSAIDHDEVFSWCEKKTNRFIHEYRKVLLDGRVVAYYRLASHDGEMELDDFYVLDGFRDRGIGSQVMDRILGSVICPLKLYVFNQNIGAMRFYTRFGFKVAEWVSPTRCIMVHIRDSEVENA